MSEKVFPKDFMWGAATASYQIEGSPLADGAGSSIWHRFSHTPGNTYNGDTGDVADNHYNKYKEDIALMKDLGLKAYRFSISWSRIFPYGKGKINEKGVDFYNRLVDELLKVDITPFVTLYHWDLPAAIQDLGGWTNRDIAYWYTDYADYMFQRLGDRVKNWITLNEPWVMAFVGHFMGEHAPGMKDLYASFSVVHNQLRAHSKTVKAFREENIKEGKIGITLSNTSHDPATNSQEDKDAVRLAHEWTNYPLFLNPIYKGEYPSGIKEHASEFLPHNYENDLEEIKEKIDFVGINYYSGDLVKFDTKSFLGGKTVERGLPKTEMGWEIYPEGFYKILKGVQDEYNPKEVYVTENGAAFDDKIVNQGVHDEDRIDYLKKHLEQALRAIQNGVTLKGYFVWSLLDNFEWALGYSKRFGIVYVDYKTQKRIIKDSGKWYSQVIKNNSFEF
ncbi:GH1 family beta-glucosidase [Petrotoga olearia]|uniref:Beta-glucosidase n=2 Tax=Petrotoga olearia TaxID=156203 RepID=A0A2K1P7A6_9BACT|nr:GH1 family beta-glucosidase [Petrotoga olearia]PNR98597.1 beta-glucosidase [Petrotoga olearia DSM 13574]RMA69301.1 broad-specificity cellobiase [Petrotoga olearia]